MQTEHGCGNSDEIAAFPSGSPRCRGVLLAHAPRHRDGLAAGPDRPKVSNCVVRGLAPPDHATGRGSGSPFRQAAQRQAHAGLPAAEVRIAMTVSLPLAGVAIAGVTPPGSQVRVAHDPP
jgi:hypothetical protein